MCLLLGLLLSLSDLLSLLPNSLAFPQAMGEVVLSLATQGAEWLLVAVQCCLLPLGPRGSGADVSSDGGILVGEAVHRCAKSLVVEVLGVSEVGSLLLGSLVSSSVGKLVSIGLNCLPRHVQQGLLNLTLLLYVASAVDGCICHMECPKQMADRAKVVHMRVLAFEAHPSASSFVVLAFICRDKGCNLETCGRVLVEDPVEKDQLSA